MILTGRILPYDVDAYGFIATSNSISNLEEIKDKIAEKTFLGEYSGGFQIESQIVDLTNVSHIVTSIREHIPKFDRNFRDMKSSLGVGRNNRSLNSGPGLYATVEILNTRNGDFLNALLSNNVQRRFSFSIRGAITNNLVAPDFKYDNNGFRIIENYNLISIDIIPTSKSVFGYHTEITTILS